jgi:hypothetical protein
MADRGPYLKTGEYIQEGDWLSSPSGIFFAALQRDGNFCVYRGTPEDNQGGLWCYSEHGHGEGMYFARLQTDGNFCVSRGRVEAPGETVWCRAEGPDRGKFTMILHDDGNLCIYRAGTTAPVWSSGHTDPVTAVNLTEIEYHKVPDVLPVGPIQLDRKDVVNKTDTEETSTFTYKKTIEDEIGWTHTSGLTEGANIKVSASLPLSVSGEIGMSAEIHETYAWNNKATKETDWSFEEPVTVKPHSAVSVVIEAYVTTIVLPYTLRGKFFLQSGREVLGYTQGVYTGTHTNLTFRYVELSTNEELRPRSPARADRPRTIFPRKKPEPAPERRS